MTFDSIDKRLLIWAVLGLSAAVAMTVQAAKFNWGDIDGAFTSALSLGASWRLEDPNNDLIAPGNLEGEGRASSSTTDVGNLNFEQGELYSLIFKGVHDLELNHRDFDVFIRVKYCYDEELENGLRPHGSAANDYVPRETLQDSDFNDLAQSSGWELLDLYGYVTDLSWGYRVRASLDYSDAFTGINLTPIIAWSHDVQGYSPPPNFNEDSKALRVGVTANYLNIYRADLS